jgi:hypothetical protein
MPYPIPIGYVNRAFETCIDKPLPAEKWVKFHSIASGNPGEQSGTGLRFPPRTSDFPLSALYSYIHLSLTRMILAVDSVVK